MAEKSVVKWLGMADHLNLKEEDLPEDMVVVVADEEDPGHVQGLAHQGGGGQDHEVALTAAPQVDHAAGAPGGKLHVVDQGLMVKMELKPQTEVD